MRGKLNRSFFAQPTIEASKELLGKFLVRQIGKKKLVGKIVETEAYIGPDDKASHASFGKTKRCEPMYGKPGIAYVYFIYGMYWMLNIVTEEEGKPCAVLVRALEPVDTSEVKPREHSRSEAKLNQENTPGVDPDTSEVGKGRIASGPGKLCRWMEIDGKFNGEDLVKSRRLWIEDRSQKAQKRAEGTEIVAAKRIGVEYAGVWKDKKWRFYLKNNPFVSRYKGRM